MGGGKFIRKGFFVVFLAPSTPFPLKLDEDLDFARIMK